MMAIVVLVMITMVMFSTADANTLSRRR